MLRPKNDAIDAICVRTRTVSKSHENLLLPYKQSILVSLLTRQICVLLKRQGEILLRSSFGRAQIPTSTGTIYKDAGKTVTPEKGYSGLESPVMFCAFPIDKRVVVIILTLAVARCNKKTPEEI